MAKLTRVFKKIFGDAGIAINQFGTDALNAPVATKNRTTLQALAAYGAGWGAAVVGGLRVPAFEEMNALQYLTDSDIAYIYQEGIAEYDANTPYFIGSLVKETLTSKIYKSLTDDNTGNVLSDVVNWVLCGDLANIPVTPALLAANNLSDLADVATARLNIGLPLSGNVLLSNNVTDPTNDIDASTGVYQFSDNTGRAVLSAITKRLDATWAVGTNQGGLDTGVKTNSTWYHWYTIYNPTTATSDLIASTNASAPALPTGYTKSSLVESVYVDSGGLIRPFTHRPGFMSLKTTVMDATVAAPVSTNRIPVTISTPLGRVVQAYPQIYHSYNVGQGAGVFGYYSCMDEADVTPSVSNFHTQSSEVSTVESTFSRPIFTNTSSQIGVRFTSTLTRYSINIAGWATKTI